MPEAQVKLIDTSDGIVYEMECTHCAEIFPWRVRSPLDEKFFPRYCPNCGEWFTNTAIEVPGPRNELDFY